LIQIFDVKDDKEGRKIYERVFLPDETWRVSLRGFGGNDHFIVDPSVNEKMRLQFIGGDGNDRYEIKGGRKNTIIEKKEERNQILHKHRSKVKYE
jgi:Ca2+-binding RTX toxin-like protein